MVANSLSPLHTAGMQITELKHQFLVAMPSLDCPMISQSVIYLDHHDEHGAHGVILNKPVKTSLDELFSHLSIEHQKPEFLSTAVYCGGPVDTSHGWIAEHQPNTAPTLTSSQDTLESVADNDYQQQFKIFLGHAEWEAQQLVQEIKDGQWLIAPYNDALMFHTEPDLIWANAMQHFGIQSHDVSGYFGHA